MKEAEAILKANFIKQNGVFIVGTPNSDFSDRYLKIRSREKRVYPDDIVKQLPHVPKENPHFDAWKKREKTAKRFTNYLTKHRFSSLLEIGCGNGWFTRTCAQHTEFALGTDINLPELQQAAKLFSNEKIQFICADILKTNPFARSFDIIVLNASIRYFEAIKLLFQKLSQMLNPEGELHIPDSSFYNTNEIKAAKQRTESYYTQAGTPEMSRYYHHPSTKVVEGFDTLFKAKTGRLHRLMNRNESPFSWYRKKMLLL